MKKKQVVTALLFWILTGSGLLQAQSAVTFDTAAADQVKKVTADSLATELGERIDTLFSRQAEAELKAYAEVTKREWLKYMPNIGVTYTVAGEPRPSISFSTSIIYQVSRDKQLRAAQREQIKATSKLEAEKEKARIRGLIQQLEALQQEARFTEETLEIDKQLFEIKKAKYERRDISPEEYLKAQRAYLTREQALVRQQTQIVLLQAELASVPDLRD